MEFRVSSYLRLIYMFKFFHSTSRQKREKRKTKKIMMALLSKVLDLKDAGHFNVKSDDDIIILSKETEAENFVKL